MCIFNSLSIRAKPEKLIVMSSQFNWGARMDIHKNARLTFIRREQLAQSILFQRMTLKAAATAFNVCARTAAKWTRRYELEGSAGLHDHSSRPHRSPRRTAEAASQHVQPLPPHTFTGL